MSTPTQPAQPGDLALKIPSPRRAPYGHALAGALFIAVLALVAYWPSLNGGFIWDDELLVSNNDLVKAPNGPYLFWFTTYAADYWPMTNTSFWLEWRLWGANSTGYHVTNLLLHIAAALLIWAILRKLAVPGAFLAALIFAVHPVNVESVAWISQRKNTLAIVFFLLSILCYLREEQTQEARSERRGLGMWYWLSLLAFLSAMLSKGSVAVLPLMLLGLAWWLHRRITLADLARTAPFLLIAIILTAVNIWFQKHRAIETLDISFMERLAGAGAVLWFYLGKALAPIDLIFIYPRWNVRPAEILWWLPLGAALLVTCALVWRSWASKANWIAALLFAWGIFCLALLPVLGFVDVGFMQYSLVADHYQHIALIAVAALAAAAWSLWWQKTRGSLRLAAWSVAIAAVASLTLLTWQQSALYRDAITLYQATLKDNPECWVARNNLGVQLVSAGRSQEATQNFEEAVRIKPNYAEAHYNLGNSFARLGNSDGARQEYERALQSRPDHARAHNNLGGLLAQSGRLTEAIAHYEQALQSQPNYPEAHNNLGVVLAEVGRLSEAVDHFQHALQLEPNNADAHHNLGMALVSSGRPREAAEQFEETLRLQPTRLETFAKLTEAYDQSKEPAKAISTAEKAREVARSEGRPEVADRIETWLKTYRSQQSSAPDKAPDFEPFH